MGNVVGITWAMSWAQDRCGHHMTRVVTTADVSWADVSWALHNLCGGHDMTYVVGIT